MTLSLATKDYNKNTHWHRVVLWEKKAEFAADNSHKGDLVMVEGRLEYREWSQDGQKRVSAEIIANQYLILASTDRGSTGRTQPRDYVEPNGNVKGGDDMDLPF